MLSPPFFAAVVDLLIKLGILTYCVFERVRFDNLTILRRVTHMLQTPLNFTMRVPTERAFGCFADQSVIVQMHADRERVELARKKWIPC
jgi:hypothetical protein